MTCTQAPALLQRNIKITVAAGVVTSDVPIKVSWFLTEKDFSSGVLKLKDEVKDDAGAISKFGLSQCPGKKMEKARDGKCYMRDIEGDVAAYGH